MSEEPGASPEPEREAAGGVEGAGVEEDAIARLEAARAAREQAEAQTQAATRALWLDVAFWPFKHGTLVGVASFAILAGLFSALEGGADGSERMANTSLQIAVGGVVFLFLAHFARRVIRNTIHDQPVPWGRDEHDLATLWQNTLDLSGVVVVLLAPIGVLLLVDFVVDLDGIVYWPAVCVLAVIAVVQFPLALAAVVVRDDVVAAFPRTTLRMWRAEPAAARTAAIAAVVFLAFTIGSLYLAIPFNSGLSPNELIDNDYSVARTAGRAGLFVMRAIGLYAALVSFRVAGLLVRDVPQVREILG